MYKIHIYNYLHILYTCNPIYSSAHMYIDSYFSIYIYIYITVYIIQIHIMRHTYIFICKYTMQYSWILFGPPFVVRFPPDVSLL